MAEVQSDADFRLISEGTMVPAFEVLRSIERYHVLVGGKTSRHRLPSSEEAEWQFYRKSIQKRLKYMSSEADAQMPPNVRHLFEKVDEKSSSKNVSFLNSSISP